MRRWDQPGAPSGKENAMASDWGNRLPSVLASLLTALLLGGCAGHAHPGAVSSASSAAGPDATSAWTLVNVLTAAGLAVPNPRDVTAQRCAEIHCAGAVDADTVSIRIFSASRDAQLYEASLSSGYQLGDVVLEFAPTLDAAQRTSYERVVARAVA
jgi:hypothetical protein